MLFFGAHCEQLCLVQFSLISLIPGLMRNLRDCADPQMDSYAQNAVKPTSLRTSERASLLTYMGLPLQIFGKGSLFGPYTPLQQLDTLADQDTKSYIVGSTNTLLLQQKDRYADVLIHVDEHTVNTFSPSLRSALVLSTPDRRWIDFLTQTVQDTWDDANPSRPKTMGYAGSEEFIRLQFEEYMLALLASAKYRQFVAQHKDDAKALLSEVEGDPSAEFSNDFVEAWMKTENFALFNRVTDSHLFDIVEPRHPCAGGLTIEDVQRRLAQQVQELHLDERLQVGREAVGKHLAAGRQKVGSAINTLWADIEVMREAQRKRAEEQKAAAAAVPPSVASEKAGAKCKFHATVAFDHVLILLSCQTRPEPCSGFSTSSLVSRWRVSVLMGHVGGREAQGMGQGRERSASWFDRCCSKTIRHHCVGAVARRCAQGHYRPGCRSRERKAEGERG